MQVNHIQEENSKERVVGEHRIRTIKGIRLSQQDTFNPNGDNIPAIYLVFPLSSK